MVPMACTNTSNNFNPTSPSTPVVVSATPTNEFGFTSTPTFGISPTATPTITPTPAVAMINPVTICTPDAPNAIAVNSAGTTLYVACESGGTGVLSIYTINSNMGTLFASDNNYNGILFGTLDGVALDATNGNYYVLDDGTNAVYEFSSSNVPVTTWNNFNGMAFNSPQAIAVDSARNIYVVDTGNNVVDEFTANGAATVTQWGYSGGGKGYFNMPAGIAVSISAGPVTIADVADMGNELIQEFQPPGVFVSQIATVRNPDIELSVTGDGNGHIFAADYNNALVEGYLIPSSPVTLTAGAPVTLSYQWDGPTSAPNLFGPTGVAYGGGQLYVADYDNNAVYAITP